MTKLAWAAALVALVGGVTCAEESPPLSGAASLWVTSTETFPVAQDRREAIDVSGVVGMVASTPEQPRTDRHQIFAPQYVWASQVITLVDDAGIEWTLGFAIRRHLPGVDVTPALSASLVGKRVRLFIRRQFWNFGAAAGFVLSDDTGLVFAMDHTDFVKALRADDLPGLTVEDGASVGVERRGDGPECFDQEHQTLIFKAGAAVEVQPGSEANITIRGERYTAHNIRNTRAVGQNRCYDVPSEYRMWAVARTL